MLRISLVGLSNCAGPTLYELRHELRTVATGGENFGRYQRRRISGRTDQAAVVERHLCSEISGEDALTIDRKNLKPLTITLPTRLLILSNELPRLGEDGAMAKRFILLRLTNSFYRRENPRLTEEELLPELRGYCSGPWPAGSGSKSDGAFVQPESAREMIDDLEDLGSPVSAFVHDRCCVGPGYRVAVGDLYAEWKAWCTAEGPAPRARYGAGVRPQPDRRLL